LANLGKDQWSVRPKAGSRKLKDERLKMKDEGLKMKGER
jgi:hypothetical protein